MKLDIIDTVLPLAVIGGVGYFAIVYGPGLMDTINQSIQAALGGGAGAQISGAPVQASGTTGTCTTGNPQMDQMITSMGMNICQATGQQPGTGTGTCSTGNVQMDQMLTSMGINVCSYTQAGGQMSTGPTSTQQFPNMQQFPGMIPGITNPLYGSNVQFPQFTGAPQFMATPQGQVNCAGGICRSYVGDTLNGW